MDKIKSKSKLTLVNNTKSEAKINERIAYKRIDYLRQKKIREGDLDDEENAELEELNNKDAFVRLKQKYNDGKTLTPDEHRQ